MKKEEITLGSKCCDTISGFTGIVVAIGCQPLSRRKTSQTHDITDIFRYFAEGLSLKEGQRCAVDETCYDPRTGKAVFFFYEPDKTNEQPKNP